MRSAIGQTRSISSSRPASGSDAEGSRPADPGFAVYVHWPFCLQKCPYCDFNSHVRDEVEQERWAKAYAREIGYFASLTPGRNVTSIFFGGGTPSLMEPATVAAVIEAVDRALGPRSRRPRSRSKPTRPVSRQAGSQAIARPASIGLSLGVQALNDRRSQGARPRP